MTVTEKLARFITEHLASAIPSQVMDIAKRQVLDTLGVALVGSLEPASAIVFNYVQSQAAAPEASVLGRNLRTTAENAALANGVAAHALDYDDTWVPKAHPSCTVFPVVMALSEKLHLSGAEALAAFIIGLEVHGKVASAGQNYATKGFHSTPLSGSLGATAAAARLLRLDVLQTASALGIAGSLAGGMVRNVGTMTKPLHAGNAARNGIVAASLAREGFTADEDIIDGANGFGEMFLQGWARDPKSIPDTLGSPFHIVEPGIGVKLYPSCYMHARPIDAVFALKGQYGITYDQIEWVEVVIDPGLVRRSDPEPKTGLKAKFSIQYNVAAAILDGAITLGTFSEERVRSKDMAQAMKKVRLKIDEAIPTDYASAYTVLTIGTRAGKTYSIRVDHPVGSWWCPAPLERIVGKYQDNAHYVLTPEAVERTKELILDLENLKDINELTSTLSEQHKGV
ncbi:MAG: MmgE/PrpD family protein [Chloroflexi bacterium]|nr:MmgE/PrpD family protein [Chloroflexota bacterium]